MIENIERNLTELEKMSAQTEARLHSLSHRPRCLLLVNDASKVTTALNWIRSHKIDLGSLLFIQKFQELTAPVVLKPAEDLIAPPFLASTINTLTTANIPSFIIYALPPLEMTTTAVNLLHTDIDLVLVVGCHCLSKREYEDVNDFNPFVEEIILKEAIQPVILFK